MENTSCLHLQPFVKLCDDGSAFALSMSGNWHREQQPCLPALALESYLLADRLKQLIRRDALSNESRKDLIEVFGIHALHSCGPHAAARNLVKVLVYMLRPTDSGCFESKYSKGVRATCDESQLCW